jgi:hypothetical protein
VQTAHYRYKYSRIRYRYGFHCTCEDCTFEVQIWLDKISLLVYICRGDTTGTGTDMTGLGMASSVSEQAGHYRYKYIARLVRLPIYLMQTGP